MKATSRFLAAVSLFVTACTPACTPPAGEAPGGQDGAGKAPAKNDPSSAASASSGPQAAPASALAEAPGVDLSGLSDAQKSAFFDVINLEPSACGKPHSLARSLADDPSCRDSLVLAQFVADRLAEGATATAIKKELEFLRKALTPREIDIEDRPVWGNPRAPVAVVVFADFQCPHCRAEAPVLRRAVDKFGGRAKLVFKYFPLRMHPQGKNAAIAAEAARAQGKFWEMHDLLFENQEDLSDERIMGFARQLGLDMKQFERDFRSEKAKARVAEDRAEGEKLEIPGTPTVYVNGREYNELLFGGTVEGWIDEALKR